ncbi:cell surface protein SprA [Bacteroidota bacterium]
MDRALKYTLGISSFVLILLMVWGTRATVYTSDRDPFRMPPDSLPEDTSKTDTIDLIYPFEDDYGQPFNGFEEESGLYLNEPSNIKSEIIYDPESNEYVFTKKIGDQEYRTPNTLSFNEFMEYDLDLSVKNYWKERSKASSLNARGGLIPNIYIGSKIFESVFGSNTIDIRPQGSAEIIFGVISNKRDDPSLDVKQRRTTNFDFQEKIQMNVIAKIGDKIEFKTNYNTEATFDFENKLKLKYEGKEDEIIKLIEAGDVTLPLNSTLITGSQSLFGIKTKLQFGRTTVTSVYSEQKSETSNITVAGGAQTNTFELKADDYEQNRHFFLAQYFYKNFNKSLSTLPIIGSSVNITKIEVWITNIGAATQENRNIVAFSDLGERNPYNPIISPTFGSNGLPNNNTNDLLAQIDTAKIRNINTVNSSLTGPPLSFTGGEDFEKVESARKLNPSEYSFNSRLGFISMNTTLNSDQVLAVAFQYTLIGDTAVYQVGEFSNEGINQPKCLIVKLLKSTAINTQLPIWDLMMKNVYSLGAYQINNEDFRLNILYSGDENGIPTGYFTEGGAKGIPIIKLLNLDNLNFQMDPIPDGVFDFIDNAAISGGTVQSANGRIYFPVIEPFGNDLRKAILDIAPEDTALANKYAYDSLYTLTKVGAQQFPDKNKFIIEGFYKSASGSEISLNAFNIPQGSVKVTAGGIPLTENVDYTVDYTLGRVRIINEGILNSGTPINISLESNSLFNIQTKRLIGTHVDYLVNEDFNIGATILNLTERPLTQKVNFGDEPISNTLWGFDLTYETESRFLTKMIDKIPLLSAKTPSKINFQGEFAHLIPGHSKAIGKSGTSYIDDFEGSKSSIDLKHISSWFLASTPQGQLEAEYFPEGELNGNLAYGYNRAKLAWYIIDPLFYRDDNNATPGNIDNDERSLPYSREILESEVFPNKDPINGQPTNIAVLNLAFYPNLRGPYNFDVDISSYSRGLNADGTLRVPESRWGGIMRKIETTDFESTNVEYIEFWMMDPFIEDSSNSGQLYFNLGDISEDILKDSRKSYENGLPTSDVVKNVDTTIWGRVPTLQALVNAFDNDPNAREYQDVGYDGLRNLDELAYFNQTYIQRIANSASLGTGSQAYANALIDPSGDDYHYFRGGDYDNLALGISDRYTKYNNPDGNSPTSEQSTEEYPTLQTTLPNVEDINLDNTLSESERYFQYRIDLRRDKLNVGENYITDIHSTTVTLANGNVTTVNWYQFKVPVRSPDKVVGNIQDFKSIRFLRMFMKGFSRKAILRFATFELVRGEWRKYTKDLLYPGEYIPDDIQNETSFDISTVSIEENGKRTPVPYVLPPDIEREINHGTTTLSKLNEQSLVLKVCNLIDGDARATYKTTDFDFRQFGNLRMYVHAEKSLADQELEYGELTIFIRLGSDFTENYYEYEVPLSFTPWFTSATDDNLIWPYANNFDIDLEHLVQVKQNRNTKMRETGSTISFTTPYIEYEGENKITVVGVPNISDVRTVMIGVRNPKKNVNSGTDDGLPKCAEVWVNELRLTDFNEKGGWAATARINTQLADIGNLIISGTTSTAGFGSIEKKVNERQIENIYQYDIATNIELGKFFPQKWGLKIPMHYDYSKTISNPEYNPLNPDIKLKDDIKTFETKEEKDSLRHLTQDYIHRKNINFINMRKEKIGEGSKTRFYHIENFNFSYAFSEIYSRNVDIQYDIQRKHRGGFGYNFTANPKNRRPLMKNKLLARHKSLAIIRDFNYFLGPKLLSFRTDLEREFNENLLRNKSTGLILIEPTYLKKFEWNRIYDFKYDITRSLKFDLNATANARIDEPQGKIDTKEKRDTIWQNILDLGRINNYTQNFNFTYNVPINKIPLLNWMNIQSGYGGSYFWTGAPLSLKDLGNTIENNNQVQVNGNLNMSSLYNKVGYLKKLNMKNRTNMMKGKSRMPEPNKELPEEEEDTAQVKEGFQFKIITENFLKILMGFKSASVSYTESHGTFLPGFFPEPTALGNNWNQNAPGLGFIFGSQQDIRGDAVKNGWLSTDTLLNSAYLTKYTNALNVRATIEPIQDFRIEMTGSRNYGESHQEYFRADSLGNFNSFSPTTTGNFSISYITWNTAFVKDNDDNTNKTFEEFKQTRIEIANRLATERWGAGNYQINDSTGFPEGYGPTSQDVLIPAFLAAYTGKNPSKASMSPFPKIPLPNWRITYTGLSKIKFIQRYLKTITLSHAYRSSYNVGSFTTNVNYKENLDGYSYVKDAIGNFLPANEIGQISLSEQFSPLFNIDMTWHNSLMTKFEVKKSRNLALSFVNNQLTEVISNEYVIGVGIRFKDVLIGLGSGNTLQSDLNIKLDLSIRSNKTILRKLDEDIDQISAGQNLISINASIDYMINQKINIRLFFDKIKTNPFISNQYPNSTTNAGIALRFTLSQ